MLKIKRYLSQRDIKIVDLHFVKSDYLIFHSRKVVD